MFLGEINFKIAALTSGAVKTCPLTGLVRYVGDVLAVVEAAKNMSRKVFGFFSQTF
jgi:hypothetical protein